MLPLIWATPNGLAASAVQSPAGAGVAGLPGRGDLPLCPDKQIAISGTSEGLLLSPCLLTVPVRRDVGSSQPFDETRLHVTAEV